MGVRKKDRQFWESAKLNNYTYRQYYNRLVELAVAMFDWKNVPDTVDVRFLELALFRDGKAVFFKDEVIGYLGLRCMASGQWDVYNVPTRRRAFATNGYQKELNPQDSVIIWNNQLRTNSILDVEQFSMRLYNLDRAIDVNANAQKTPILITCDDEQRLSLLNLYQKYDGNQPVIFGTKALKTDSIKTLTTDAPYVADKLYQLKTQYWNEALTYLGISNVNFQKKERMISDEVSRQMGGVIANRYSRLNARKKACEEINKMFGLNMDVEYREDFRELDDEFVLEGETGNDAIKPQVVDMRTKDTSKGITI